MYRKPTLPSGHLPALPRLLVAALIWVTTSSVTFAEQALDRVVLEVNKKSYSQRYVEIYMAAKDILAETSLTVWKSPNSASWGERLEDFVRHAVIDQEALRLNSFRPSARRLEAEEQLVIQQRGKLRELEQYFTQLKTDKATLREALAQFDRVRSFIRVRNHGAQNEEMPLIGFEPIPLQAEWYRSIERRTNYRTFAAARSYRPISPL